MNKSPLSVSFLPVLSFSLPISSPLSSPAPAQKIEAFDGVLLGEIPLTHFVDMIHIWKDRVFSLFSGLKS